MRLRLIRKNEKGVAIIYLALLILVLIAFVGIAVDLGYVYVAKGQLQNAADAAALAGAGRLDNRSNLTTQPIARNEAVKYAGLNIAAGAALTLDPNTGNDPNGDVVLGNWNPTRPQSPCDQRFLPVPPSGSCSAQPLPSGAIINAVKAVARRNGETGTGIGTNNRVSIFFGKIFALLPGGGSGWTSMTVKAQSIAFNSPPVVLPLPLCFPTCGYPTNLDGTTLFYFNAKKGTPNVTWSSFLTTTTNKVDVENYITGRTPPPDLCGLLATNPPVCLFTTQGTVKPDMCTLISQIRQNRQTYEINGQQVNAWKVFVPIFDNVSNTCGGHTPCLADPGNQPGDAYNFIQLGVIYLVDAVAQGNCAGMNPSNTKGEEAIGVVGDGPGATGTSTIRCATCDSLSGELSNIVKLVK